MKCPCGCKREVPHGHFWATESCGRKAKKHGVYMPANGEWRKHARLMKKIRKVKHG